MWLSRPPNALRALLLKMHAMAMQPSVSATLTVSVPLKPMRSRRRPRRPSTRRFGAGSPSATHPNDAFRCRPGHRCRRQTQRFAPAPARTPPPSSFADRSSRNSIDEQAPLQNPLGQCVNDVAPEVVDAPPPHQCAPSRLEDPLLLGGGAAAALVLRAPLVLRFRVRRT